MKKMHPAFIFRSLQKSVILFFLILSTPLFAQLAINTTMTPLQLVQNVLVGGGVTVSNVTMTGTAAMYGSFTNGSTTNLGLDAGILLTTGNCTDVDNPVVPEMSTNNGSAGDADLGMLTSGSSIYNKCILEFDFKPLADTVRFRYVFGSEEYPEYVCSIFNDVFGFFLSGPGITGPFSNNADNIALIPGTTYPVAINTVNQGNIDLSYPSGDCQSLAYASDFVYNESLGGTSIVFDGFTTIFTAWHVVTPCQQYHIKIAISDVSDPWLDSGVFLEANSFSTNGVTNNTTYTSTIDTMAVEGCNNAIVHFYLNTPAVANDTIFYTVSGTATNGFDYPWIGDSVVFLPGQDSVTVVISPFSDGIPEPVETIYLVYANTACGGGFDSIPVYIRDYVPIQAHDHTYSSCSGQAVTLNLGVTGGFPPLSYNWTGGGTTQTISVSPASSTNYALNISDVCGGFEKDTAFVLVSNLASTISSFDSISCFGLSNGYAYDLASGGIPVYTYSWNTVPVQINDTATGLTAGTYIVTVTDSIGCTSSDTVVIWQPPVLNAAIADFDSIPCYGQNNGFVTAAATGGTTNYSYQWNTTPVQAGVSAIGLSGGIYTVTITDAKGCTATASATVFEPSQLTAAINTNVPVVCNGGNNGSLTVTPGGGTPVYSYSWSTTPAQTTPIASNLIADTYTVTVTDANGCSTAQTANVTQPSAITVNVTNIDSASCFGQSNGSITIAVNGGTPNLSYLWNTTPPQTSLIVTNLSIGTYTVTVTDGNSCTTTASATIYQPPQLTASISSGNVDSVVCFGQSNGNATVTVGGGNPGYSYLWNSTPPQNTATASNVPAGTYTVTVSDVNGCTQTASTIVSQPTNLVLNIQPTDEGCENNCNGQVTTSITGGIGPYTFYWDTPIPQTTATILNLCADSYSLTVTDANGCTVMNNATVGTTTYINDIFTATPTTGIVPLTVLFNFTGTGADTYNWDFGNGNISTLANPQNIYSTAGTYTVTLIINSGSPSFCPDTFFVVITVENPSFLIVPNIFTPNGDGYNDEFHTQYQSIETFDCIIFNRWGLKMFEWTDVTKGWDGKTEGGKDASDGVYYYILNAKGTDNIVYEMHGTVTLLR